MNVHEHVLCDVLEVAIMDAQALESDPHVVELPIEQSAEARLALAAARSSVDRALRYHPPYLESGDQNYDQKRRAREKPTPPDPGGNLYACSPSMNSTLRASVPSSSTYTRKKRGPATENSVPARAPAAHHDA